MSKALLYFVGLSFAGYGGYVLVSADLIASFIGYGFDGPDARIEMLAMYGGLEFGFGVFCILAASRPTWVEAALVSVICVMGSLAIARTAAFALSDEAVTWYTYSALALEWLVTIVTALALSQNRKPSSTS